MAILKITTILFFCIVSCFATYGPSYQGGGNGGGSRKIHIDSPKIHLDNPKILLHQPRIHVQDHSHYLGDEEPIILENDKPLYIRKTLHGIPSSSSILISEGHGHGYGGYGAGKLIGAPTAILAAPAPIITAPAPIAHEAILIRRPAHIAHKELAPTQDHLEKLHLERLTLGGGYSHGHPILTTIPLSKGIQENTIVYEKAAPLPSLGHGLISFSAYHAPAPLAPARILLDAGHHGYGGHGLGGHGLAGLSGGKDIHHGGNYKKY